jgi:transposase
MIEDDTVAWLGGCAPRARGSERSWTTVKYSPDLDPIEQVFARLKIPLRKTAARSPSQTQSPTAPRPQEMRQYKWKWL